MTRAEIFEIIKNYDQSLNVFFQYSNEQIDDDEYILFYYSDFKIAAADGQENSDIRRLRIILNSTKNKDATEFYNYFRNAFGVGLCDYGQSENLFSFIFEKEIIING